MFERLVGRDEEAPSPEMGKFRYTEEEREEMKKSGISNEEIARKELAVNTRLAMNAKEQSERDMDEDRRRHERIAVQAAIEAEKAKLSNKNKKERAA